MEDIDILTLDLNIKEKFNTEEKNLLEYEYILEKINKNLLENLMSHRSKENLTKSIRELEEKIKDIKTKKTFNFYIMESSPLIEEYRKILQKPIKISFMNNKAYKSKEKDKIILEYINILKKYKINISCFLKEEKVNIKCSNCLNKKKFELIDETTYICTECSNQQDQVIYTSSYKDAERINISTKCVYDRRIHFKDRIKQYQGKQNSTIEKKVYKDLEEQFRLHNLLVKDAKNKKEKFSQIKKKHIYMFLKETGHSKHYEDVILIYYNLTGKNPNNISHLEDKLLENFDELVILYDKKFQDENKIDRINFMNTDIILYQLLRNEKYPCKKEDFHFLKSIETKFLHNDIIEQLFREKNWNYHHIY